MLRRAVMLIALAPLVAGCAQAGTPCLGDEASRD